MTEKDKKIIKDAEKSGSPFFILVAKDKCAVKSIIEYFEECRKNGCDEYYMRDVSLKVKDFLIWQKNNPRKMKMPD